MPYFRNLVGASLSVFIYTIAPAVKAAETATYQYDALGRLTQVTKSGGPAAGAQTTTAYDAAGNRASQGTTGASGSGGGMEPPPPPPPPPLPPLPVNNAPTAYADSVSLRCYSETTVNLVGNDSDADGDLPLTLLSITQLSGDSSVSIINGDSVYIYGGARSTTSNFSYTVQDSRGATNVGKLTVRTTGPIAMCNGGGGYR